MRAQIAAAIVFTAASSASYVCAADVSPDSPTDEHSAEAASQGSIAEAAGRGAFLAGSQAASLEGSAMVAGFGGYDGARRTATFESRAELRVWGPVVVSGGALYSDSAGRVRPSVGPCRDQPCGRTAGPRPA